MSIKYGTPITDTAVTANGMTAATVTPTATAARISNLRL